MSCARVLLRTVQGHTVNVWCEKLHHLHPGLCSSVRSDSGLCYSVLLLWRQAFAVGVFCFGIQKTSHLCCGMKMARMKKSDTCTECNSVALPFQIINILPLCVHLCRSSCSGSLLHSPALLTEDVVFSQMPLPSCHCTAVLKVLF